MPLQRPRASPGATRCRPTWTTPWSPLPPLPATYGYTEKQYLGLIYGSTMTRSIYEEQTRRSLLATAYLQSYQTV